MGETEAHLARALHGGHQTALGCDGRLPWALASFIPTALPLPEEPRLDGGISHVGQGEGAWPPWIWIPVLPWALTSMNGGD